MGCTHPYWSALQVGSQHLARQFARNGWQVHYFSASVSLMHLPKLFTAEVKTRFKRSFYRQTIHENGRIHSYVPFSLIAPDGRFLLRSPVVTHNWYKLMIPTLKNRLEKFQNKKFSLIYIDNLSYHFLLDELKYQKSVFRVMDMHERFAGWKGEAFLLAKKIVAKTDLTVYSARGLKRYTEELGVKEPVYLPNGVDFDFFRSQQCEGYRHPLLANIADPVVLYTGMVDSRLDYPLIRTAAIELPKVSFVFTGMLEHPRYLKGMPKNVLFTGPVPHEELPWLMKSARAGIIPFEIKNNKDTIAGIHPLKLLEYFAAGIPVISAKWPEVEALKCPAWLYGDEFEFIEFVKKIISRKEYVASAEQNFAEAHEWSKHFKNLMNHLQVF